jgi:hypothetical protein
MPTFYFLSLEDVPVAIASGMLCINTIVQAPEGDSAPTIFGCDMLGENFIHTYSYLVLA